MNEKSLQSLPYEIYFFTHTFLLYHTFSGNSQVKRSSGRFNVYSETCLKLSFTNMYYLCTI